MKYLLIILSVLIIISNGQEVQTNSTAVSSSPIPKKLPSSNGDGFTDSYTFFNAMKDKQMTKVEINEVFSIADKNSDGLISELEWTSFYEIFVSPFQDKCDLNKNYLLDVNELQTCLQNSIKTSQKMVQALDKYDKNLKPYEVLINLVGSKYKNDHLSVNFNGYLFLRRAAYAWHECTTQYEFMIKSEMLCAAKIMSPEKQSAEIEINVLFNVSQQFSSQKEIPVYGQIKILGFLSLFKKLSEYNKFNFKTVGDANLIKKEMLQALEDGRIRDDRLTIQTINKMFSIIKNDEKFSFDFKLYFILMNVNDLILLSGDKNSKGYLNQEQFHKLLEQQAFRSEFMNIIDSSKIGEPTDEKPKPMPESAKIQKEKEYFNSFLQLKMKVSKNHRKKEVNKISQNKKARDILFNILDSDLDQKIDTADLLVLFKLLNVFKQLQNNKHQYRIYVSDIKDKKNSLQTAVPLLIYDLDFLAQLADYDENLPLNFLQFIGFYQYNQYFQNLILNGKPYVKGELNIQLKKLVLALKKYGLVINSGDLKLSRRPIVDKLKNQAQTEAFYDYDKAFKLAQRQYSQYIKSVDIA